MFSLVEEHGCLPENVVRIYVAEIALAIGKTSNNFKHFLCREREMCDVRSGMYKLVHVCVCHIDFLHNAGIAHRDIKPTNILLDKDGHAVIIDFGFAKWLQRTERTNTFCGTPEYMGKQLKYT